MATAGEAPVAETDGTESPDTAPPLDVKAHVVHGVAWKMVTQVVVQFSRIGVGIILAHLLTPNAFGLAAMAITFVGLFGLFSEPGLGPAIVQRRALTEADRSTAFWTTLAFGVTFTTVGIATSSWVAHFFGHPEVQPLFAALSLGFTLDALSSTQNALLTRELAFRSLQLRQIFATIAGGVIAVVLAFAGAGAWAIIGQSLGAASVAVFVLWRASPWRPRLMYSVASLREMWSFGIKIVTGSVLSYFTLSGDNLLIGKFLGATALGTYALAYNLMFTPMTIIAQPIHQVAFPGFARMREEPHRLVSAWLRGKRISSMFLAPAYAGLIVMAPDIIRVLFGPQWTAAIPVVQLLSLAGLTQAIGSLNWTVLIALGRAGTFVWLNVLETAVVVSAFVLGLKWGIVGVAGFYALSKWPTVLLDTHFAASALGVRVWRALWAAAFPSLVLAGAMGLIVFGLRMAMVEAGTPPWLRLAVLVPVAVLVYAGLWRLFAPALFAEVKSLMPRRLTALRKTASQRG